MSRRRRSTFEVLGIVAGVAGLGLAAAGVVLNVTASGLAGRNTVLESGDPLAATNSPSVVRNPRDPDNLAVAYRVDRPGFSALLQSSFDGGRTWTPTALPLPADKKIPYAPDLAFGPDGRLYVLYSNLVGRQNEPENLWLASSDDGGRTLSPPSLVASGLTFQPRLAASPPAPEAEQSPPAREAEPSPPAPEAGPSPLYVTWLQAYGTGILRFVGQDPVVVAVRSTDGGRTFSAPVRVSDPGRARVGAATPVIDSTGRLVVMYEDFKGDRRDFEYLEGPPYEGTFALVLTVSEDGGRTFSTGFEIESGVVPTRRFLVYLPEFPSLAAGPDDVLYASWSDGRNGDEDVFARGSGDGGRTWTDAVRVNDNRLHDGTTQTLPRVAVSADRRVDVVFYDRRDDAGSDVMTDVTLARSTDGGLTWSNSKVSDQAFDSRVGPTADVRFGTDFGTRLGLVAGSDGSIAAWADSRFGDEGTGRQDVLVADASRARKVPVLGRWPVVVTFAVIGCAALALAVIASRRRSAHPGPGRDVEATPSE